MAGRGRGRTANVCRVATYIEPLYTEIRTLNLINDRVAAAPPARELDLAIGKTKNSNSFWVQLMAYVEGTEFEGISTVLARIRVSQRLLRWRAEARGLLRMSAVGARGACDLTNRRSCQPPPILAQPARRPYLSSNQRLLRITVPASCTVGAGELSLTIQLLAAMRESRSSCRCYFQAVRA